MPASNWATNSGYPKTSRSSSSISPRRLATISCMRRRSSGDVKRNPCFRHDCAASLQPFLLKMKKIAGSRPSSFKRSTTSRRLGVYNARRGRPLTCPRPPTFRVCSSRRAASGFGRPETSVGKRCSRCAVLSPTMYRFSSSTGRFSSTTNFVGPRTVLIQSATSLALLTVADRHTNFTRRGRWIITSSQTGPRKVS